MWAEWREQEDFQNSIEIVDEDKKVKKKFEKMDCFGQWSAT